MADYVSIFDTTLRDGEQSPGCSMNREDKCRVAAALDDLGVDVIEAGFPAASPGDSEAVAAIAAMGLKATVCALARCHKADIDEAAKALAAAPKRRLHVFIATSPIHRQYKLGLSKEEVVARAVSGIEYACRWFDEIEFSAEDAGRTEKEFLLELFQAALDAGARILNVPDTVGYVTPAEFGGLIRYLKQGLRCADDFVLSCHCHNDLGLAVANSLAAVENGARQVECTINGIGERAGNCALEELTMALKTRRDHFPAETGINTRQLAPVSKLVSSVTGSIVQANKAIVGKNAFAHEAGIHQDGMLKHEQTYEIMRPEDVGVYESQLVLGKHSGRHAFREHLNSRGVYCNDVQFESLFQDFKHLADRKKQIYDEDIDALLFGDEQTGPWALHYLSLEAMVEGRQQNARATVGLTYQNQPLSHFYGHGDGPVNAVFNAIRQTLDDTIELQDFTVRNITAGDDAQGQVSVNALINEQRFHGTATATDIVEASAQALVRMLNRYFSARGELPGQTHQAHREADYG